VVLASPLQLWRTGSDLPVGERKVTSSSGCYHRHPTKGGASQPHTLDSPPDESNFPWTSTSCRRVHSVLESTREFVLDLLEEPEQ
jgi:hypothetical protein